MKINRLNIGEEVRRKVEESGLSKAKFAELLGIARQNIEKTVFQKFPSRFSGKAGLAQYGSGQADISRVVRYKWRIQTKFVGIEPDHGRRASRRNAGNTAGLLQFFYRS